MLITNLATYVPVNPNLNPLYCPGLTLVFIVSFPFGLVTIIDNFFPRFTGEDRAYTDNECLVDCAAMLNLTLAPIFPLLKFKVPGVTVAP